MGNRYEKAQLSVGHWRGRTNRSSNVLVFTCSSRTTNPCRPLKSFCAAVVDTFSSIFARRYLVFMRLGTAAARCGTPSKRNSSESLRSWSQLLCEIDVDRAANGTARVLTIHVQLAHIVDISKEHVCVLFSLNEKSESSIVHPQCIFEVVSYDGEADI